PDVAFIADIYPGVAFHYRDHWSVGNGTSQAAPIFAGLVLVLNESNERRGRPRVGFANPLLYELAATSPNAFFDVVEGDNVVGDQHERFPVDCCFAGPGFDAASGWGSLLLDEAIAALADHPIRPRGAKRVPGERTPDRLSAR